ncbi:hypothetical protein PILCRDRAFT_817146 [Piloderma croceum F 1598]|uniref:Uncharacterized protein n=1 Tax=Piloderma croceum (strain F 1598) TaxID=765440 RepID=A0A0C3C694_PILCF|nr:hypothetical protein PILCRDRAFT_817146 [Piloderma croceum F 1598]
MQFTRLRRSKYRNVSFGPTGISLQPSPSEIITQLRGHAAVRIWSETHATYALY